MNIRTRARKEKAARLEQQLQALQDDVSLLQEEHSSLSFAHDTLQHMEELLAWMLQDGQQDGQQDGCYADELPQALSEEPQHLASSNNTSSTSIIKAGSSHGIFLGLAGLVSPPNDPLRQLRLTLQRPPYSPPSFTVESILQEYAADVADIAVHLYKADALQQSAYSGLVQLVADRPFEKVHELLQRRFWVATSLVVQRQTALLTKATLTNSSQLAGPGLQQSEPNEQRHTWAVQQIGLSQQQLATMAAVFRVYRGLLAPVLDEVRQLQQEIGGSLAVPSAGDAVAASAAEGSSSQASDDAIRQRLEAADLHQQKARRLQALLHKDFLIKMCAGAHVFGCLTWGQMGRLLVLMAPHVVSSTILGPVVERLWRQQQQQQQQQQAAAATSEATRVAIGEGHKAAATKGA